MVVGTKKLRVFPVVNNLLMAGVIVVMIYPVLYLVLQSVAPYADLVNAALLPIPSTIDLSGYSYVFQFGGIPRAYLNTIVITLASTALHVLFTSIGAYVLAQRDIPFRGALTGFLVFTMLFSGGLIPTYLVVKGIGLTNTLWALIIPPMLSAFWIIVTRNFFQSLPPSLSESARIDGSSELQILFRIVLPLSMPILSTLALFQAVGIWNTYFTAIIYVNDPDLSVLQVIVRNMYVNNLDSAVENALPPPIESVRAAAVVVTTLPILFVYPFLQKYFTKGVLVGAVKG